MIERSPQLSEAESGRRRTTAKTILAFAAVALAFWAWTRLSPGIKVSIHNRTNEPVSKVRILFAGGSREIASITPGKTETVKVRSVGESSLIVEYVDSASQRHVAKGDVYFESSYRGEIDVWIEPGGTRWGDDIEIGW